MTALLRDRAGLLCGCSTNCGLCPPPVGTEIQQTTGEPYTLYYAEKKAIIRALDACDDNRNEAAELLGCARSTLFEKLKKYRMNWDD